MAWLRLVASLLTAVLLVLAAWLTVLTPTVFFVFGVVVAPTSAILGLAVGRRQPRNIVGLHLTLIGLAVALMAAREGVWQALAARPALQPSYAGLVAVLNEANWWSFAIVGLLLV
jgi:hypothetical protein